MYGCIFFCCLFVFTSIWTRLAHAAASCTASVDLHSVTTYSRENYVFTVENTGANTIHWLRLTRPSTNFTADMDRVDNTVVINPGDTYQFNGTSVTYGNEASSANWTLEVAEDTNGTSPTACTG